MERKSVSAQHDIEQIIVELVRLFCLHICKSLSTRLYEMILIVAIGWYIIWIWYRQSFSICWILWLHYIRWPMSIQMTTKPFSIQYIHNETFESLIKILYTFSFHFTCRNQNRGVELIRLQEKDIVKDNKYLFFNWCQIYYCRFMELEIPAKIFNSFGRNVVLIFKHSNVDGAKHQHQSNAQWDPRLKLFHKISKVWRCYRLGGKVEMFSKRAASLGVPTAD